MMLYTVLVFVLGGSVVCHQDHPHTDQGESTNQKQTSEGSGLSDGLKVGLAIGAGLVAAVVLLLIALCCCLKSRRNSPEESESLTKPTTKSPVDAVAPPSGDNDGLPQHIHYVPYNPKDLPRNDTRYVEMGPPPSTAATNMTQSGDHVTQSGDHAMYEEIKTQDISDEYSEPDKTRTKTTVQMVDNDVYERSGEVKPTGQDNKGFDETGENTTSENERHSVVKMVDNDVYNKD